MIDPENPNFNPGAVRDAYDPRDYQYSRLGKSSAPFDWNVGFDVEAKGKLVVKDQGDSYSCGGQAFAAYAQSRDQFRLERSAKFIYSQVFVPGGGSDGRTICKLLQNRGVPPETVCASYENGQPPSEAFMERAADLTAEAFQAAALNEALVFASVATDVDSVAQAMRDNDGCVIGITGTNNGTWRSTYPQPPVAGDRLWSHWVLAGKARLINGQKYIGIQNSWNTATGDQGWQWLPASYFKSNSVWGAWTIVPKTVWPPATILQRLIAVLWQVAKKMKPSAST